MFDAADILYETSVSCTDHVMVFVRDLFQVILWL